MVLWVCIIYNGLNIVTIKHFGRKVVADQSLSPTHTHRAADPHPDTQPRGHRVSLRNTLIETYTEKHTNRHTLTITHSQTKSHTNSQTHIHTHSHRWSHLHPNTYWDSSDWLEPLRINLILSKSLSCYYIYKLRHVAKKTLKWYDMLPVTFRESYCDISG